MLEKVVSAKSTVFDASYGEKLTRCGTQIFLHSHVSTIVNRVSHNAPQNTRATRASRPRVFHNAPQRDPRNSCQPPASFPHRSSAHPRDTFQSPASVPCRSTHVPSHHRVLGNVPQDTRVTCAAPWRSVLERSIVRPLQLFISQLPRAATWRLSLSRAQLLAMPHVRPRPEFYVKFSTLSGRQCRCRRRYRRSCHCRRRRCRRSCRFVFVFVFIVAVAVVFVVVLNVEQIPLLAPFVHAGGVWPRGPLWSCQGCIPPEKSEKRTDEKKGDFLFTQTNLLRLARIVVLVVVVGVVVLVVFVVVFAVAVDVVFVSR